jgi:protein-disulfide isomerase
MDRRFIIVLAIVIIGLGGLFVFTRNKAQAPGSETVTAVSNHTEGNTASGVKLLVYGDFQCSACVAFYPIEKQVVDKYIDKISFTFREFPLDSIHPNARASARAAEAAGLQGKFFEMHNMLYENQDSWLNSTSPLTVFEKFATMLGLDANKFKTDFSSEAVNSTINADYKEGTQRGVSGTPSYYLNDKLLNNEEIQTVEKFSAKIDEAIQSAVKP